MDSIWWHHHTPEGSSELPNLPFDSVPILQAQKKQKKKQSSITANLTDFPFIAHLTLIERTVMTVGWCYWVGCLERACTASKAWYTQHISSKSSCSPSNVFLCFLLQFHPQLSVEPREGSLWMISLRLAHDNPVKALQTCGRRSWCSWFMDRFVLQTKLKRWHTPRRHRLSIWRSPQSNHAHPVAAWSRPLIWM